MNSTSIDTLLKVSAPAAKPAPASQAGNDAERFNTYLRQATTSASAPKPAAKPEPPLPPVKKEAVSTSTGEQGATASPEDESVAPETVASETAEQEPIVEDVIETDVTDEILISAAAAAGLTEQTDTTLSIEVPTSELTVDPAAESVETGDGNPSDGDNTSTAKQTLQRDLGSDFASGDDIDKEASTTGSSEELSFSVEPAESQPTSDGQVAEDIDQVPPPVESQPSPVQASAPIAPSRSTPRQADEQIDSPQVEQASGKTEIEKPLLDDSLLEATELVDITADSDKSKGLTEKTTGTNASTSTTSAHPGQSPPTQPRGENSHSESHNLRAEGESPSPTIDRARFVQRVANAFRSAQQNDGHIQLRLSPPELGQLRIEIAVRHGVLSANLETETADARRVLLDNLPALRQRLAEQDIRIDKFEVDIRRDGGQQGGQADAQEQQSQQQSSRAAAQNRIRTTHSTEDITTRVPRVSTSATDAGLDVRI